MKIPSFNTRSHPPKNHAYAVEITRFFWMFPILLLGAIVTVHAQGNALPSYVYPIQQGDQFYAGKGIDWILKKSNRTQYYLFGEQHGNTIIPKFIDFIHDTLNTNSLHHLAVEMDSWTTQKISQEGIEVIAERYPHSIAFDYDPEIALLQSAGKRSEIWGLDQMFIAIHPFERLHMLAENENTRRLTQGAFLKASLKMGNYIRESHFEDLDLLESAFAGTASKEAQAILKHLRTSMEIYVAYSDGQRGAISPQVSVTQREDFMIQQFEQYMQKNPLQKVVFKMGGAHLVRGIGPNGVPTLGDYISRKAAMEGANTLAFGIFNHHDQLPFDKKVLFAQSNLSLVDCKAYLETIPDSLRNQISGRNKALLQGYDALILIHEAAKSKRDIIVQKDAGFKSQLLRKLSSGAIVFVLLLLLFLSMLGYGLYRTARFKKHHKILIVCLLVSGSILGIFGLQIYILVKQGAYANMVSPTQSIWFYLLLFIAGLYLAYRVIGFAGTGQQKTALWIHASLCLFLIAFMYYWNIGGMISL